MLQSRGLATATLLTLACLALLGLASCQWNRRAPGEPSMNESMHRRMAASQQGKQREADRATAQKMTAAQIAALETHLESSPADETARRRALWYYDANWNPPARRRHVLWITANAPAGPLAPVLIDPLSDREGYEEAKRLWLGHARRPGATPQVILRAAEFLAAGDRPLAEELLLAGKAPPAMLGRFYADTIANVDGPQSLGVPQRFGAAAEYAFQTRRKLDASTDAVLLANAAMRLFSKRVSTRPETAYARRMMERAIALDAGAHPEFQQRLRKVETGQRLQVVYAKYRDPEQALPEMAGDERALLLASLAGSALYRNDIAKAEQYARQLDAASYEANVLLGKIALRRGNKRLAAEYLIKAGNAADLPAEPLLELPRALVDWGEREAAAAFLDRLASRYPQVSQPWRDWAQQLRKGINPDLIPYTGGCAHDPC